jgi:lysophospholipase L1-like esterase
MKSSRTLWGLVSIIATVSTLVFAGGFVYASNQILFPKAVKEIAVPTPNPEAQKPAQEIKDKLNIVALGDSLTAGTGDLTGKGYVQRVREKLEQQMGKPVYVLNNLAVPGYTSLQLLQDLELKKTKDALADADLILFTIGGNDIFQGGQGIFGGQAQDEFNPEAADKRIAPALERMDQVLGKIHEANPDALVIYTSLYHPFLDLDPERKGSLTVQKWNNSVFALTNRYPNMVIVPTYDLFERNLSKYLYTDHFHPNQDGYERIADRIVQIMK